MTPRFCQRSILFCLIASASFSFQGCRKSDDLDNGLKILAPVDGEVMIPGKFNVNWESPQDDPVSIKIASVNTVTVYNSTDTMNGVATGNVWQSPAVALPGCTYTCTLTQGIDTATATFQVSGLETIFPDTLFGTWNTVAYDDVNGYTYSTYPGSILLSSDDEHAVVHMGANTYTIILKERGNTLIRYEQGMDGDHEFLEIEFATGDVEFELRRQYGMGSSMMYHFAAQ